MKDVMMIEVSSKSIQDRLQTWVLLNVIVPDKGPELLEKIQ